MSNHKLTLPVTLREQVVTAGRATVGSGAALARRAIEEYAEGATSLSKAELADFVFDVDDAVWARAQARAKAEHTTLSRAISPLLREAVSP